MLAETAASPRMSAPIIPTVVLNDEDTLTLASPNNSKENSIISISKITGNGMDFLALIIANNKSVGISS